MFESSSSVVAALKEAGWHENRNVTNTLSSRSKCTLFQEALVALREFDGIHFGTPGAGIQCGRSEISIDAKLADYFHDELQKYREMLQTNLLVIGEIDDGYGYMAIDESGRIYLLSFVSLDLIPLASTFHESLELLFLGKRLTRPQIESIWPNGTSTNSKSLYSIIYDKRGIPAFVRIGGKEEGLGQGTGLLNNED